jgi:hypothetical protein
MANKSLATRQKMRLRVEPSQVFVKPRNPLAGLAKSRSAGPHRKSESAERGAAKRALKKTKLESEE